MKTSPLFILIGFSVALSSCNGGSSSSGTSSKGAELNYSACSIPPTQGKASPAAAAPNVQVRKPFGKKFDENQLIPVLETSAAATISYVRNVQKINLVKVYAPMNASASYCPMFGTLPAASTQQAATWKSAGGGVGESSLRGLYLFWDSSTKPYHFKDPTIILAEDGDRWTIVHEMMHHLYNLGRRDGSYIPSSILNQTSQMASTEALNLWPQLVKEIDHAKFARFVKAMKSWYSSDLSQLKQGELEEVAIESLLIDLFAKRQFAYTPDDRQSGYVYMLSSLNEAATLLDNHLRAVKNSIDMAKLGQYPSEELEKQYTEMLEFRAEVADVLNQTFINTFGQSGSSGNDVPVTRGYSIPQAQAHTHSKDPMWDAQKALSLERLKLLQHSSF